MLESAWLIFFPFYCSNFLRRFSFRFLPLLAGAYIFSPNRISNLDFSLYFVNCAVMGLQEDENTGAGLGGEVSQ